MHATIFRHNTSKIGSFARTLQKAGVGFEILDTWLHDLPDDFDALAPELLIVMGGAPDVYQADFYPFMRRELNILEKRLAVDLPTLGICLGAQLMAGALGARSYHGRDAGLPPERGWYELQVNAAGMKTPIRHLDRGVTRIAESHKATFDLPDGATLLASTELYPNQVFSYGQNALGIQAHPEADDETCRAWFVSYASDMKSKEQLDTWRVETAKYLPVMERQSEIFLTEWIAQVGAAVSEKNVREIVLDTETTGMEPSEGHRLVEIGCVELYNQVPTGRHFHKYLNPERDVHADAVAVHGLTRERLAKEPMFSQVYIDLLEFIDDGHLVIHNASFDMKFLNWELSVVGHPGLPGHKVTDTLALARQKFPGSPASLDALCRRFGIDNSGRDLHGALLDAQLLAEVYLEMKGGRQHGLGLGTALAVVPGQFISIRAGRERPYREPRPHAASAEELAAHTALLEKLSGALWKEAG